MATIVPINYIELKPHTGTPRISGHGITVAFLSTLIDHPEWPVERICEQYDLTPAQVHAAWSYYYDHKEEIDRYIKEADELAERLGTSFEDFLKSAEARRQQQSE